MPSDRINLGLIVNPFAGLGGPEGLKGSDQLDQLPAVTCLTESRASQRAARCLARLQPLAHRLVVHTGGLALGEAIAKASGLQTLTHWQPQTQTCAEDTRELAKALAQLPVDLLLFVGGDGTARDVCAVVGNHLPVLGVPAGVKMHSGVFAVSPEAAADVVSALINGELVDIQVRDVRDIDEALLQQGQVNSRYFGEMQVPLVGEFVQATKLGGRECEELVVDDLVAFVAEQMDADTAYLVGAGTTTQALMDHLGCTNTLLGVDLLYRDEVCLQDASATQLENWLQDFQGDVVMILSVTGGQGSLIGRGNQQLSPAILRRVGKHNLWPLATKTKIHALAGRPLLIDSNDPELDVQWSGFIEVITGYNDKILYPLGGGARSVGAE